jgi:hypothetical protein
MRIKTIEGAPPTTESDLDRFQVKHGIVLPAAYRRFILETNGGRPDRDLFSVVALPESPVARIHFFFGMNDPEESCDLDWNREVYFERLPPDVLAIAKTEGPDLICIRLTNGETILYWDALTERLLNVADGFESFLSMLYSDELSPCVEA